ncbi:MAG: AAA family ATPase [Sphingobacteriaceae bacterium]|nr:AAA family ATPase [Sphingobacteriaceae bacterium]
MKIKSIRVKNYRGFKERDFSFDDHFNVIIGNNATGKTALLDALALSMSTFFLGIDGHYSKTIKKQDVRKMDFELTKEKNLPVQIEATGEFRQQAYTWLRELSTIEGTTKKLGQSLELQKKAKLIQKEIQNGSDTPLPVFAYYGTGRLWKESGGIKTKPKSSRFDGYFQAAEPLVQSKTFMAWMKTQEIAILQKNKDAGLLNVVKACVGTFLEGTSRVFFDVEEDTMCLETITQNGRTKSVYWNMLSDGYRNVIAMSADLAYRCVTLNPHLGIHAAAEAEGIVLIDELDLHLHPKWQRTIVESFKKAFPKLQFITTTHSPFIIQSLQNHELIDLEGKNMQWDYRNKGLEEIIEKEMEVENPHRSEAYLEKLKAADAYFAKLEQLKNNKNLKINSFDEELKNLELKFRDDPAYVALLKSESKI